MSHHAGPSYAVSLPPAPQRQQRHHATRPETGATVLPQGRRSRSCSSVSDSDRRHRYVKVVVLVSWSGKFHRSHSFFSMESYCKHRHWRLVHCELGAAFCKHAGVQEMHTQPRTRCNLVLPLQRPAFRLSQGRRVRAHPSPRSRRRCWRADRRLPHSQTRARMGTPPSPPPRPLSPVSVERHDVRSDGGFVNRSVLFQTQTPHCLHVHWLLCATAPCGRTPLCRELSGFFSWGFWVPFLCGGSDRRRPSLRVLGSCGTARTCAALYSTVSSLTD